MKKNDYYMMKPLSGEEHVQVSGGYVPPTEEQMEELRKIYGPLADIICWWILGSLAYDIVSNWNESVESFNKGLSEGF